MGIFASANQKVMGQYALLARAVERGLPAAPAIDSKVSSYAQQILHGLDPSIDLPPDGAAITEESATGLLESFLDVVAIEEGGPRPNRPKKKILTAGDVAFTFSCLAYYALGRTAGKLACLQRDLLLEACDIAEKRPLPVMRWTNFVRSNINDTARVRTVMRSCVYSKTLLGIRLSKVFRELTDHLRMPKTLRILAIGSSGTVGYALKGLTSDRSVKVFLTRPTPGIVLDYGTSGLRVENFDASKSSNLKALNVDLVLIGCGVIGKTRENEIEAVNWARDIALAKLARKQGIPLLVIGALYKMWPQPFYETHKDFAVELHTESALGPDAILTQKDIDWLVTEHEAVSFNEADRPKWVRFLLDAHSLDVTSTISMCANKKAFVQHILENEDVYRIDNVLGQLMDERSLFERYERHPEDFAYMRDRKLPAQFLAAHKYYLEAVQRPEWRKLFEGKFVAIMGTETIAERSLEKLLDQAYTKWGYRPIFYTRVGGQDRTQSVLPAPTLLQS